MYKLFLDTHSEVLTIAFICDDEIFVKTKKSNRSICEICIPTLKEMLDEKKLTLKDFDEILVVNGPGSFTGLRIGLTIAKTLAVFANIRIKTISSLVCYCVSSEYANKTISIIEENNGYYYTIMENNKVIQEAYVSDIEFLDKNLIVSNNTLNIKKVFDYANKNIDYSVAHSVKANYIKKIEAEK